MFWTGAVCLEREASAEINKNYSRCQGQSRSLESLTVHETRRTQN
jgi:hypothetical protein